MANPQLTPHQKRFRRRQQVFGFGATALVLAGLFATYPLHPKRWIHDDDILPIIAGLALLQMAIIMAFTHTVSPKDAPMPRQRLAQVLNFLLGGAALLLPVFGQGFLDPAVTFGIVLALTAGSVVTSWLIWRDADELMKSMLRDASVAAFQVTATALCIYAAGERLGVLSGVTAWGFLGFVSLANLVCSFWVIFRRGEHRIPAEE